MSSSSVKFALIGVGFMGRGMAKNLAIRRPLNDSQLVSNPTSAKNMLLSLYDPALLETSKQLELLNYINQSRKEGNIEEPLNSIEFCASPLDASSKANIVALSLPSEEITENVLFGKDGVAQSNNIEGKIIMEHGTFSRDFVLYCASRMRKLGAKYVDCPVSGGPQGAHAGTLTFMIGGETKDVEICRPVLSLYGSNIFHFGDVGTGMAAKLVNQALVAMHAQAASEAVCLSSKFGIKDTELLQNMLRTSWGQSKVLDLALDDVKQATGQGVDGLKNTKAPLRNLLKDLKCVENDLNGNAFPLIAKSTQLIDEACKNGLKDSAFVSLAHMLGPNSPFNQRS